MEETDEPVTPPISKEWLDAMREIEAHQPALTTAEQADIDQTLAVLSECAVNVGLIITPETAAWMMFGAQAHIILLLTLGYAHPGRDDPMVEVCGRALLALRQVALS